VRERVRALVGVTLRDVTLYSVTRHGVTVVNSVDISRLELAPQLADLVDELGDRPRELVLA
jgi:hypothetical protein